MMNYKRRFFPGSPWLYIKIYCGEMNANKLLLKFYEEILIPHEKKTLILKSFFIRYHDPHFQIRMRMELSNNINIGTILPVINQVFHEEYASYVITKIQIDTYERELERYSEILMNDTEYYFSIDSNFILSILKKSPSISEKLLIAVFSLLNLMEVFNFCSVKQQKLINSIKIQLRNDFNFSVSSKKILSKKITILNLSMDGLNNDFILLLNDLKVSETNWFNNITMKDFAHPEKYVTDLFHMRINRLFTSNQRIYEYICYHIAYRKLAEKNALLIT